MKKFLTIILISTASAVNAQQISLNSQYLFNDMLVNPGATGMKDYIPIQLAFRKQWTNFPGSPTTQALSCDAAIVNNIGFGGTVFNDVAGPSRRTGVNINGSYHLKLEKSRSHILGLGVGFSLAQHAIDEDKLTTYLPDDAAVLRGYNNTLVPDASFGIFYKYLDKGYVGLSAFNLVQSNRDLYDFQNGIYNPLVRTYYLYGGYNFNLNSNFRLKTSALVQGIETLTIQFDVTTLLEYKRFFWFGFSYRYTDAAVAMIGGQAGPVRFGYSYDYTLSDIGKYSSGSHEVFLELQLTTKNSSTRTPWLKRNRIYSPKI